MPRPLQFSEIYTHRGRKHLLSCHWTISEIAQCLGLKLNHGQPTHHTPRMVRAFIVELGRTTSDLLDEAGITGEPGEGTFTPTSLTANVAFIGIARTISQKYGPSLWGRDRRDHLVWPRDVEGFTGLYWAREKDRYLIQFLVRCWLVRQTYKKQADRKHTRLQQIRSATESSKVGRSTSTAKRMYHVGSDSDYGSDDEPLITKITAVRGGKSRNPQPRYILDDEQHVNATRGHGGNDSNARASGYDSSFSGPLEQHSFSIDSALPEDNVPRLLRDLKYLAKAQERPLTTAAVRSTSLEQHSFSIGSVLPEDNVPKLLRDLEYLAKGQERQSTTAPARNASSWEGLATPSTSPGTAKSLSVSFARDDSFPEGPDEERPSAQEIIFQLEELLVEMQAASARSSGEDCGQDSELSRSRLRSPSPARIPRQADTSTRKDTPSPAIYPTQRAESQQTNMVQRASASSAPDSAFKIATPPQAILTPQADRSTQTDISVQARRGVVYMSS